MFVKLYKFKKTFKNMNKLKAFAICLINLSLIQIDAKEKIKKAELKTEKTNQAKLIKTPKKGIDLQKAMDYPIPEIIKRYKKDYGVSDETAKMHEKELKRYLILAAENYPKGVDMFSPQVDDLWHTFLLFTKDYKKYCEEVLGQFIHHVPKTHENEVD